jgi:probable selenium-dependent hydroxylase accessory protein YqeC
VQVHINSSFGIIEALRIEKGDVVSLVGAGGKTTTLYGINGELRRHGMTVITTTTTHMQTPQYATTLPPLVYAAEEKDWLRTVRDRVNRYGSATVVGAAEREDKLSGLDSEQVRSLQGLADCVILEADGARGRSLKVPAAHEPVIPDVTSLTVVIVGLDVLGLPMDAQHVHRLDELVEITGADPGTPVSEELIATALTKGYLPKLPRQSGRVFFVNKVDDSRLKSAENLGRLLLSSGAPEVVFGQAIQPNECFYRMIPGIV